MEGFTLETQRWRIRSCPGLMASADPVMNLHLRAKKMTVPRGKSGFKKGSCCRKTPRKEVEYFWEELYHPAHVSGQQVFPTALTPSREVVNFQGEAQEIKKKKNSHNQIFLTSPF